MARDIALAIGSVVCFAIATGLQLWVLIQVLDWWFDRNRGR